MNRWIMCGLKTSLFCLQVTTCTPTSSCSQLPEHKIPPCSHMPDLFMSDLCVCREWLVTACTGPKCFISCDKWDGLHHLL